MLHMPELPEAERARDVLESVLGRRIVRVHDNDTYVSRPHAPGEIAAGLVGHTFAVAHRRGKFLWLETDDGPVLGLHLGMAGRIVVEARRIPSLIVSSSAAVTTAASRTSSRVSPSR